MALGLEQRLEDEVKKAPGSYQRLDLFIKVLRVLCPNVTAAFQELFFVTAASKRRIKAVRWIKD